jgi:putative membrane protein
MRDTRRTRNGGEGEVLKGLAAGLIGGLVASWTMNRFQDVWSHLAEEFGPPEEESSARDGGGESQQAQGGGEQTDDATVKAASAISEGIFDHELTKSEKKIAGPAVHYAFGTSVGGLYGAVAELAPEVTAGAGLPFGAAFWLVADETAVPLLGLSKPPTEYPLGTHVYALASHFVYGLTTEVVRRVVRRGL